VKGVKRLPGCLEVKKPTGEKEDMKGPEGGNRKRKLSARGGFRRKARGEERGEKEDRLIPQNNGEARAQRVKLKEKKKEPKQRDNL